MRKPRPRRYSDAERFAARVTWAWAIVAWGAFGAHVVGPGVDRLSGALWVALLLSWVGTGVAGWSALRTRSRACLAATLVLAILALVTLVLYVRIRQAG